MSEHAKATGVPSNPILRALYGIFWAMELPVKKVLFGCQGCGHCVLKWTALTCPMRCPKQLRNGPCGGVREDGRCEVYPERECQWVKIHRRAGMVGRTNYLRVVQPPIDWRLKNTSSWINHFITHLDKEFFEELWHRTQEQAVNE
jgi:hypothetical protein